MNLKKLTLTATLFLIVFGLLNSPALAKGPSLEKWKPAFDPSGVSASVLGRPWTSRGN